jgi:hypothetical protein
MPTSPGPDNDPHDLVPSADRSPTI